MKTKIYQIATVTFFSLLILVGNVYADGSETSAIINENIEEALEIESWMIDDSLWNGDDFSLYEMEAAFLFEIELALEVEADETLEVENWMMDDETFGMETARMMELETALEIEIEEALEVENWMISDKIFNVSNILEIEKEQDLELETWITDSHTWNR